MSSAAALAEITQRIAKAATAGPRVSQDVTLIAVSKTFPAEAIVPVLEVGHRDFGENRVQEAMGKWPPLREAFPDVTLHLIGPLQTNKVAEAVSLFDVIHSLDRPKLARKIKAEMDKTGKTPHLFVQVNTGEEDQKAGIAPQDADQFIGQCRDEFGLTLEGLMCVPPVDDDPAPHFALLAKIAERNELAGLSMGMSADFEQAVRLGATHVRVGSAIFGAREGY